MDLQAVGEGRRGGDRGGRVGSASNKRSGARGGDEVVWVEGLVVAGMVVRGEGGGGPVEGVEDWDVRKGTSLTGVW